RELVGDRLSGLLRAFQRARDHVREVIVHKGLGDRLGHLHTEFGQPETGQPPVQDPARVVHLAVAEHVHDGPHAAAASRAAGASAASTVDSASSSRAADTNHASNALGGRYTPRASMPWKN